jgi:uncharacterized repeat protein (TIGR01451 family)
MMNLEMKPIVNLLILCYCCSLVSVYPGLAVDINACKLDIDLPQSVIYDLTIAITLPRGLIYNENMYATPTDIISETISSPNDGSRDVAIAWKFDKVDNTADKDLSISFQVIAANTIDNRDGVVLGPFKADLVGKDSHGMRITGSAESTAARIVEPDLEIFNSVSPASGKPGDIITYNLTVFHSTSSHANAYEVDIADSLPPEISYLPGSFRIFSGPQADYKEGQSLKVHFANLDHTWGLNNKILISFMGRINDDVKTGAVIINDAQLTWASAPGDHPQRRTGAGGLNWYQKSTSSSIRIVGLSVTKECSPNPVDAGNQLTYIIKYKNDGADLHGVVIKETYDELVEFKYSVPPPDKNTDDQWTLGELKSGSQGELKVYVQVDSSAQEGIQLENAVNITSNEGINAYAKNNTTIKNPNSLTIIKEASKTLISQESPDLQYTITLKNNDLKKATNVEVTDIIDDNLNYVGSSPPPSKILGRSYSWEFSDLEQGDQRTIAITTSLKPKAELNNGKLDKVYNLYKVESKQSKGRFKTLETEVMHSLFIVKKAEKRSYSSGELINYTITYGNSQNQPATNVKIFDKLPDVEFLYAEPSPSSEDGNLLKWDIGELPARTNRSISLTVRLKKRPEMNFQERGSISGVGYVYTRSRLSTDTQPHFLTNYVNITGSYVIGPDNDEVQDIASSSDSVAISDSIGTEVGMDEHGSGYYHNEQKISLNNSKRSIILDKQIDAKHAVVSLSLLRGRNLSINSPWHERTYAKNRVRDESLSKTHLYADSINESIHLQVDENQTVYQSTDETNKSLTRLSYKSNVFEISEEYQGSFKTTASLSSYGSDRIYDKYSAGVGFVSSDKRVGGKQRSYEYGSGSYNSSEVIGRGIVYKMMDVAQFSTDHYTGKWNEGMSTKDSKFNSSISERISQADHIEKEAIMGPSSLSMTSNLTGMASTKFKIQNGPKRSEELLMEQFFSGTFRLNYVFGIQLGPKYLYPHLNLTKTALKQDADTVLFQINVTNDGNKTLGPVDVMDMLPAGMIFVNSSLISSVVGQNVSWTLLSLPIGQMQTIDLRARLRDTSYPYQNDVIAVGKFGNEIVTAKASVIVVLDWLPCCLQYHRPAKKLIQDKESLSFFSGTWKVPGCMGLNGTVSDCEQYIDEYYNSSESTCHDCLFDATLPEVVYQ